MEFKEIVSDAAQLRELIGDPKPRVVAKTMACLNQHCRTFIDRSPFLLLASSNAQGHMDISPKGDPPGFVQVLDESNLAIPDRPGNRRADTYTNVLQNPKVGLIFLIPGKSETLRVSGTARIVRDIALRESMAIQGKIPAFALAVEVEEAFFPCSKCIVRSELWDPAEWPELEGLPTLAETALEAAKLSMPLEELDKIIRQDALERLY